MLAQAAEDAFAIEPALAIIFVLLFGGLGIFLARHRRNKLDDWYRRRERPPLPEPDDPTKLPGEE